MIGLFVLVYFVGLFVCGVLSEQLCRVNTENIILRKEKSELKKIVSVYKKKIADERESEGKRNEKISELSEKVLLLELQLNDCRHLLNRVGDPLSKTTTATPSPVRVLRKGKMNKIAYDNNDRESKTEILKRYQSNLCTSSEEYTCSELDRAHSEIEGYKTKLYSEQARPQDINFAVIVFLNAMKLLFSPTLTGFKGYHAARNMFSPRYMPDKLINILWLEREKFNATVPKEERVEFFAPMTYYKAFHCISHEPAEMLKISYAFMEDEELSKQFKLWSRLFETKGV